MPVRTSLRAILVASAALFAVPALAAGPLYTLDNATTLPSTNTGWDHITLDAATGRLFIARRADGLTVFDINTRKASQVDNSKGANGALLVPEFNRIYVACTDGTVLVLDMTTLKPIDRFKLDNGDLNAGFYEPTTKQVYMIAGSRPKTSTWINLDAATGKILGRTEFDSKQMDIPAVDKAGHIFAPTRDTSTILKLDADLKIEATWKLGECTQPVAVEFDRVAERLLVVCRGDKPVFVALDAKTGKIVATLPIGHGTDGLAHNDEQHVLVSANGGDASLSVIQQEGPDKYRLLGTITSRPMVGAIAMDPKTKNIFVVTAHSTQPGPPADGKLPAPIYHDDSFTVLTYAPK